MTAPSKKDYAKTALIVVGTALLLTLVSHVLNRPEGRSLPERFIGLLVVGVAVFVVSAFVERYVGRGGQK